MKKIKSGKGKITKSKRFCPACGSINIMRSKKGYVCSDCGAIFREPKRAVIKMSKKPRYIG